MRVSKLGSVFVPFLLASISSALQVTPNSPCSMQCIDNDNGNPANSSDSNTSGKDLTCNNADYSSTTVGQKFKNCLNCLQTSTYSASGENDQAWFIYNLRYVVDWCLYGYPDNSLTIGGPCVTSQACGPLATALESGALNPSNGSTYDYCTADGGAFMGQTKDQCTQCLNSVSDNSYLSNFIVALQAGCEQKPSVGTLIGLNGTVFTSTQVTITTPSTPASTTGSSSSSDSSGLSTGAKVAITVSIIVALLILIGITIICWKKRQGRKRSVESNYDPRFGAPDISSPMTGAYINPYYKPPAAAQTLPRYVPSQYSTFAPSRKNTKSTINRHPSTKAELPSSVSSSPPSPMPPTPTSITTIPVHQAYNPNASPGYVTRTMSPDVPSPPNSTPSSSHSHSVSSQRYPRGAASRETSPRPSPTAIPPYNPQKPLHLTVPIALHPIPGRQLESPESQLSVEQWPGSM